MTENSERSGSTKHVDQVNYAARQLGSSSRHHEVLAQNQNYSNSAYTGQPASGLMSRQPSKPGLKPSPCVGMQNDGSHTNGVRPGTGSNNVKHPSGAKGLQGPSYQPQYHPGSSKGFQQPLPGYQRGPPMENGVHQTALRKGFSGGPLASK